MNEINTGINTSDERLRSEIADLKRQLNEQKNGDPQKGPSRWTLLVVLLLLGGLAAAGYFLGYLPRQKREMTIAAESQTETQSLPVVNVERVTRSVAASSLVLPGNIQAVTEGPVFARASGYIKTRSADIGDRVTAGQPLAEIEAPELDQQIVQAKAAVDQANAATQQADASLEQGRANESLAGITAQRWANLLVQGVVSRQDNDTYQSQWKAQQSNVQALEKAVAASKSNASAAAANVARLVDMQNYLIVRAPFAGVITVRSVDVGVLVTEGTTLLFHIAQTDRLRTFLNVPQADAGSVRVGQKATLTIPDLGGRKFTGTVTRTANALDPATRTLLVEVQVANESGLLLPGMYAQEDLLTPRKDPPLVIPGGTLVVRSDGPQVAVIKPDGTVHYTLIQLGRDFGDRLEVLSGLKEGEQLATNPSDAVREGAKVKPVFAQEK